MTAKAVEKNAKGSEHSNGGLWISKVVESLEATPEVALENTSAMAGVTSRFSI